MKKIILLALAALLIFTMVSCDGNADFLLWNEEEAKYIILEFDENIGDYSFDINDTTVKTFKWVLEGNPSTFSNLEEQTVKYYLGTYEGECTIYKGNSQIYLVDSNASTTFDLKLDSEYVAPDDLVSYGSTYTITI